MKAITHSIKDMAAVDISIPLVFEGRQPNAFGAAMATAQVHGDTGSGSSVNYASYTVTPHCNGTHTECIGHITDERISVRECLKDVLLAAAVVSVEPETNTGGDLVISRRNLEERIKSVAGSGDGTEAIVIRTLPNDASKLERSYDTNSAVPYFAADAIQMLVDRGIKHLLVDLPSIDRMDDGGALAGHRIFWNIKAGSRKVDAKARIDSTITELIFVPNEIADGEYLLNLQIAPFEADAAPSRPVLLVSTDSVLDRRL